MDRSPLSSFTEEQIQNMKILSINEDELPMLYGSIAYRTQRYPGDIDLQDIFKGCCTKDDVAKRFAKRLQEIVYNILSTPYHYFSDFKAGLDEVFDVDIGKCINSIWTPNWKNIMDIYNSNKFAFTKYEKRYLESLFIELSTTLNSNFYDKVGNIFREKKIVRWTSDEILKGKKYLLSGLTLSLSEAVKMKSHVKIDMISLVDSKFVEITNFYVLIVIDSTGLQHIVNLNFDITNDDEKRESFLHTIRTDIEKNYFSSIFFNLFKASKRMWALSRITSPEIMKDLTIVVNSELGSLNQIKSEIEVLIRLTEIDYDLPKPEMIDQLESIKFRLRNITFIDDDTLVMLNGVITRIINTKKFGQLKVLYDKILLMMNIKTVSVLDLINLNPPPISFLPKIQTYSRVRISPDRASNITINKIYGNNI